MLKKRLEESGKEQEERIEMEALRNRMQMIEEEGKQREKDLKDENDNLKALVLNLQRQLQKMEEEK